MDRPGWGSVQYRQVPSALSKSRVSELAAAVHAVTPPFSNTTLRISSMVRFLVSTHTDGSVWENNQHARLPKILLRPLLLLGGVADALNEALQVVRGVEGMSAARAADACEEALKLLKKELKDVQEMQAAQEMETAEETLSPGDQSNLSLD